MAKKIDSKEYKMLLLSFDFIRCHQDKTTECLPDELIRFWSVPDFAHETFCRVDDSKILVFMYILKLYLNSLEELERILNSTRFNQLFYHFQVILAATAYSRRSHIPVKPCRIFDVGKYAVPELEKPGELIREYNRITKVRE